MDAKIQDLLSRRRQHDQRINCLLNNATATDSSIRTFEEKSIDQPVECMNTFRSSLSKCSRLSRQVNLLANLQTNRGEHMIEESSEQQNFLKPSIVEYYGQNIEISIQPHKNFEVGLLLSDQTVDFEILVNFIEENQLWGNLFVEVDNQFYVKILENQDEHMVNLSAKSLLTEQLSLVTLSDHNLFIGFLLLYRTMSLLKTGSAPQVLRKLLGAPYKSYSIQKTSEYFNLVQYIEDQSDSLELMLLGRKLSDKRLERISCKDESYDFQCLIQKYEEVDVIVLEELSVRSLNVAHRRNHHTVIDIETKQEGKDYFSFTDGSFSKPIEYRFCIVDENLKIVHHELISNNQFGQVTLKKGEFKLYLSQINEEEQCRYRMIVQSRQNLEEVEMGFKFIEQYNNFTRTIINQYMQSIDIATVEKEIERLKNVHCQSHVSIIRLSLNFLGFNVDFLSFNPAKMPRTKKVKIEYCEKQALCDIEYRESHKSVEVGDNWVFQIYLSKKSEIKGISGLSFSESSLFL